MVTEIQQTKRGRFSIFGDGEFLFSVHKDIFLLHRELAAGRDLCIRELDGLEREAALGRKWLFTLREEVVRMGALADSGLDRTVLKQITDKLDAEELQALKRAYQARARERYPLPVQLEYAQKPGEEPREDGAFLI